MPTRNVFRSEACGNSVIQSHRHRSLFKHFKQKRVTAAANANEKKKKRIYFQTIKTCKRVSDGRGQRGVRGKPNKKELWKRSKNVKVKKAGCRGCALISSCRRSTMFWLENPYCRLLFSSFFSSVSYLLSLVERNINNNKNNTIETVFFFVAVAADVSSGQVMLLTSESRTVAVAAPATAVSNHSDDGKRYTFNHPCDDWLAFSHRNEFLSRPHDSEG